MAIKEIYHLYYSDKETNHFKSILAPFREIYNLHFEDGYLPLIWVSAMSLKTAHHWSLLSHASTNYLLCLIQTKQLGLKEKKKRNAAWVMLEFNGSLIRRMSCLCLWWFFASTVVVVMGEDEQKVAERQLNQTPTWAVACVCTFFIVVSVVLEKLIHKVGTVWFWSELVLGWFNANGLSLIRENELSFVLRFWVLCSVWIGISVLFLS